MLGLMQSRGSASSHFLWLPLIFFVILFTTLYSHQALSTDRLGRSSKSPASHRTFAKWRYNFHRDANSYGLSKQQCESAFPDLYQEIETAIHMLKGKRIKLNELDIAQGSCMVRAMIYESEVSSGPILTHRDMNSCQQSQLYIIDTGDYEQCNIKSVWEERVGGLMSTIHRAIVSVPFGTVPNIEFTFSVDESVAASTSNVTWGFTRKADQNVFVVPDYAQWSWPSANLPSFSQARRRASEKEQILSWEKKKPEVVWRGNTKEADLRKDLIVQSADLSWSNIKHFDIWDDETEADFVRLEDHCDYQYAVHTEGLTYSGRLKYLQLCNLVPVVHRLEFIEHHHHLMIPDGPDQNFIQVERNFSDLVDKMEESLMDPDAARAIAQRSYDTFFKRYLTPAAGACYLRRMFAGWASVQGFEVHLYTTDEEGQMVQRGIPWEGFSIGHTRPRETRAVYGNLGPM